MALAVPLSIGLDKLSGPEDVFLGRGESKSKTSFSVHIMSEGVGAFCGALVVYKTSVASFDKSDLENTSKQVI